jgi:hypothetical protein
MPQPMFVSLLPADKKNMVVRHFTLKETTQKSDKKKSYMSCKKFEILKNLQPELPVIQKASSGESSNSNKY